MGMISLLVLLTVSIVLISICAQLLLEFGEMETDRLGSIAFARRKYMRIYICSGIAHTRHGRTPLAVSLSV
jgi:hypothetical protein